MNGVSIQYGNVAPEAKENFIPTASDSADISKITQLQQYNLTFPNVGNPCELYSVPLDGNTILYDDTVENIGLWSNSITDENGDFATPITLTLTGNGQYTSQGFTLTFDKYNNIFANDLTIKWYRNNELINQANFEPTSAFYFCKNYVENFDKVEIIFNSMNMPYNRLKLRAIDYGHGTVFYGEELLKVIIKQSLNPLSTQIEINTCDFTLASQTDEYSFQNKQPLSISFNDNLIATTFVSSSKRTARKIWEVQSEDYIGIMDGVNFYGGMYTNQNAYALMKDIFDTAKVPYEIDDSLQNVSVSGHIKYTSCRDALMQVAFATKTVVDTTKSAVVKVYKLSNTVKQSIPLDRIKTDQTLTKGATVTEVHLTSHTYQPNNEVEKPMWPYDSQGEPMINAEIGKEYFITFSEPLHDLALTGATMIDSGVNFAKFTATSVWVELTGKKYNHTTKEVIKRNPTVLATELDNIVKIENATLVSDNNIDDLLNFCYNEIIKTNVCRSNIWENRHISGGEYPRYGMAKLGQARYGTKSEKVITYDTPVDVGDLVTVATEYKGDITGRVREQTFNLNGNIILKDTELTYDNG